MGRMSTSMKARFTALCAFLWVLAMGGCSGELSENEWGAKEGGAEGGAEEALEETSQAATISGKLARITGGESHSLAVRQDGTAWAWGDNAYGQLGNGDTVDQTSPVQVQGLTGVVAVAAGTAHSVALSSTGAVWTWGRNNSGQLGDGTIVDRTSPSSVGLSNVVAVAAGSSHTLAVKADGSVWAWGRNDFGQLGDGGASTQKSPVQVKTVSGNLTGVVAIAAGYYHSLALRSNGSVWAWGNNAYGQLGNGTTASQNLAVQVNLPGGSSTSIAAGKFHSLALQADGKLYTWGYNRYGQIGDSTFKNKPSPVAVIGLGMTAVSIGAGFNHSLAVLSNGKVMAWGQNYYGQLGNNSTVDTSLPVQVQGLAGIEAVEGGANHSIALGAAGGALWSWGYNANGELGNGSITHKYTPVPVEALSGLASASGGDGHTLALRWNGTLWAWGYNAYGQLGDGSVVQRLTPVAVHDGAGEFTGAVAISAGAHHSLALKSDGTVWTFGQNDRGQLGDGSAINRDLPVQVKQGAGYLTGVIAIAAGANHSLALKSDGTVWAWGHNLYGQLGNGTNSDQKTAVKTGALSHVVAIAAGANHSLAACADGTAYAWGRNSEGQLGDNTTSDSSIVSQIPTITSAVAVAAGVAHSLILKAGGAVVAFGDNAFGQLGDGTTSASLSPLPVAGLTNVVAIAGGAHHSMASKADGTVWAWGRNSYGQLGNGTTSNSATASQVVSLSGAVSIAAGAFHSLVARPDGTVWSFGRNNFGQLGDANLGTQSVNAAPSLLP